MSQVKEIDDITIGKLRRTLNVTDDDIESVTASFNEMCEARGCDHGDLGSMSLAYLLVYLKRLKLIAEYLPDEVTDDVQNKVKTWVN